MYACTEDFVTSFHPSSHLTIRHVTTPLVTFLKFLYYVYVTMCYHQSLTMPQAMFKMLNAIFQVEPFKTLGVLNINFFSVFNFAIVRNASVIKAIVTCPMNSDKPDFVTGFFNTWIGKGLITANGHQWKRDRKTLQPIFSYGLLKSHMAQFGKKANLMVANMKDSIDSDGVVKNMSVVIGRWTLLSVLGKFLQIRDTL